MLLKNFSVWQGVYSSFTEAGGDLDAFESDIWLDKQKIRFFEALKNYKNSNFVSKDYPLPLIVSMELLQKEKLNILDFGGGYGLQYLDIISKIPQSIEKIEYFVVDGQNTIDICKDELKKFDKLKFFTDLEDVKNIDIIHIGSTLQYIEDWKQLLLELNELFNPKYFVFSDLLAGNVPSFVSHQIFYDKKIPVNILNIEEVMKFFSDLSFFPIYKTYFQTEILGQAELPNTAIPDAYRIKHAMHLILVNKGK